MKLAGLHALSDQETWVAVAAGNSSANAAFYQPACVNRSRILTVSSMVIPHVDGICHIRQARPRGVGSVSNKGENNPIAKI